MMYKLLTLFAVISLSIIGWRCKQPMQYEFLQNVSNGTTLGFLTISRSEYVSVIDLDKNLHLGNIHGAPNVLLEGVAISSDREYVFLRTHFSTSSSHFLLNKGTGLVKKIDIRLGRRTALLDAKFHPNKNTLFSAATVFGEGQNISISGVPEILVFDLSDSLRLTRRISVPENVKILGYLAISPDGNFLAVSTRTNDTFGLPEPILLFDLNKNESIAEIKAGRLPFSPVFSADSRHLYVPLSGERSVAVVDIERKPITTTLRPSFVDSAWAKKTNIGVPVLGPDQRHLYLTFGDVEIDFNGLIIIDTFSDSIREEITYDFRGRHLAFGSDPSKLYITTTPDRNIIVFDLRQEKKINEFSYNVEGELPSGFFSLPKTSP